MAQKKIQPLIPTIQEGNKLKVSKEHRQLVEAFMGYADGYLSGWVTWNDVMPVAEKIGTMNCIVEITTSKQCRIFTTKNAVKPYWNIINGPLIEAAWLAVVDFIKWDNQTQNK
jgi:hypothetical protein